MLKQKVLVDHEKISRQILENFDSIAFATKIQILLQKYEEYERVEDTIFEKLPPTLRQALKEIDKVQDEIIRDIMFAALKIGELNRKSNALWKPYDVKGSYARMKRLFRLPLFGVTVRRWKRGRIRRIPQRALRSDTAAEEKSALADEGG